jgi:hypothetical protein
LTINLKSLDEAEKFLDMPTGFQNEASLSFLQKNKISNKLFHGISWIKKKK